MKQHGQFRHVDDCQGFSCNTYCLDQFYTSKHTTQGQDWLIVQLVLIILLAVVCGVLVLLLVTKKLRYWKKGVKRNQFEKIDEAEDT